MAVFLIALAGLAASGASAADLIEIQRLARENDAQFAAARSAWLASQERVPQARALLLPLVTLSANVNRNDTDSSLIGATNPFFQPGRRTFDTSGINLQITQPLYRRANAVQLEQANIQLGQADLQLLLAAQELTLRTAQAYFDVLGTQEALAVLEAQKAAIGEQLALAKASFEVGSATIVDYNEARSRYDIAVAQEIIARGTLEVRRQALQQIIGRDTPPLRALGEAPVLPPPVPSDMEYWSAQARANALQVRLQQAALDLATREIERQRAGHLPTVDAVGSAGQNRIGGSATSSVGNEFTQYALGLQLNVPIFQGGGTTSRVREAFANRERAVQDMENARRGSVLATRQAYVGLTAGINEVSALEAVLASSRSSLESTQLGQKVGVRNQVDVLNAQQIFFAARRDLVLARYSTLLSSLRLQAAVGDLDDDDLLAINALLR
jgi:outer membrane protein